MLLSDRAFRLHLAAICWTARHGTACVIPSKGISQLFPVRQARKAADELVAASLWATRIDGDFLITHDAFSVDRDPEYGPGQRERIYSRDGHRCGRCGATDDLTLDHIHPRSRAGGDSDENLATLCRSCNSAKGARI
ncbi:HNH endonuclease [Streptomyces jumonjinensis]|uniref:HNH endonuclease n=2 Tax=Streptomyces jumonjinensis TaxID=1945 RepID=A0A646KLF0_STRJU|nr:HNH endonuclease [Streptomyces jumonjinensis]